MIRWLVAIIAVVVSQIMTLTAWGDAKAGTVANVVILVAAAYGFASVGPMSFRMEWRTEVVSAATQSRDILSAATVDAVEEEDLVLFAPAALVDAPVRWTSIDDRHVRGVLMIGSETVTAEVAFNDSGDGNWYAPEPEGHCTYIEFGVDDIIYNVEKSDFD